MEVTDPPSDHIHLLCKGETCLCECSECMEAKKYEFNGVEKARKLKCPLCYKRIWFWQDYAFVGGIGWIHDTCFRIYNSSKAIRY
jgi:hypothetical protein